MDMREKLIDYYKNLKFDYGDFDGMSNAEDIVGMLEKNQLHRLGWVASCPPEEFRTQEGLCKSNTSHLPIYVQVQQCIDCWNTLFEERSYDI